MIEHNSRPHLHTIAGSVHLLHRAQQISSWHCMSSGEDHHLDGFKTYLSSSVFTSSVFTDGRPCHT